ncbi:MAG: hypothetical protein R6X12_08030 [bacterium]
MAQSKGRVVIWTIVGILVVAAVIFTFVSRQGATASIPFEADDVPKFTRVMENRIEAVGERAAKMRGYLGDEEGDILARVDQHMESARELLQKMQTETDAKVLGALKDSVQDHHKAARRLLRQGDED